eukprot:Phypoly_transcript_04907.p1 GENE.Phypoly_transcript_04907~~Phypoly_transcript_04907.p1  ORF type:complete len:612 (-),score=127.87 Phypoly_transcript_04907:68-1903(-)
MACCWSRRNKRIELDEDEKPPAQSSPGGRNDPQISLHDYIFSPKDFCDSVLQKKLIPEYYLNGIDISTLRENELRLSQDSMNDSKRGRNGLRASQGDANARRNQRNLRSSQSSLRTSRSNLRASQGLRANEERASLTASQGDEEDEALHSDANEDSQRTALLDEDALRASLGDDSGNALRKSQGEDGGLRTSQDGALRKSQDGETQALAQEEAGSTTPRKSSARYSSFFSSVSYTNINYYEEFCALFPHFAIVPTEGYRVELGGRIAGDQELFLEEQDAYNLAYQRIFQKNDHHNFVGGESSTPFIISILACDDVEGGCRTIVRTKHRDHYLILPHAKPASKMARTAFEQIYKVDKNALPDPKNKKFSMQQIRGQFIVKDLANFEDKAYKSKHKMGILYSKGGQTTEEEMFSNTEPSFEFLEFLDMIGERVPLRGFPDFNGGLDTKNNLTGTESYYTTHEGVEIMFHVSTLLPYTPDRPIQIERKKHIGNDIVCIVFMDSPTPFKPNTITSKFIHVIIVVQFLERNSNNLPVYRVSVASKLGVEPHHPILPTPPHFEGGPDFRKFLLTKAINAERAATHAPAFKLARTRMNGLATIVEKHTDEPPPKKCFG